MEIYPPGSLIAERYEVIQPPDLERGIRVGGWGFIYFCRDTETDRLVALKLDSHGLPNRAARNRFLREGTVWVELGSHPHIVRCYVVKYIDPIAYIVMELIANERDPDDASLCAWLGASMPLEQALLFALQIARGMQYAAGKIPGFVHRDLKPGNVLVSADKLPGTNVNRLCITDFGLIKIVADSVLGISAGAARDSKPSQVEFTADTGTPGYMAPEQYKDEPVGIYTDVYALGCILYEMLTGQRAANERSGELPPLPQNLPSPVRSFLEHSLAPVAAGRYQTWDEVTSVLEWLYAGLGWGPAPQESRQESEGDAERRSVASSYNAMGISFAHMGKTQEALGYFEKALGIFQEIHDRQGEGTVQGNLGNVYARLGHMDDALRYCEQDLAIARERDDQIRESLALGNIGEIHRNRGDIQCAINFHEKRLEIVKMTSDLRGEGNTWSSLGMAYAAMDDVKGALACYKKQLAITRRIGDRRGRGNAWGNLGNAYSQLGEKNRAIFFYKLYLKIAREIGDLAGEGIALGNLGSAYLTPEDAQTTIDLFYKPSLEIARAVGDRRGESVALGNLGIAYAQMGKTSDALDNYKQKLEIAREIDDKEGLCSALFNMGLLYMQNKQVWEAATVWVDLYVFARQNNIGQALQRLAKIAPKVGLPEGLAGWERLRNQRGCDKKHL